MKKMLAILLAMMMLTLMLPTFVLAEDEVTITVLASTWSPYDAAETSVWDELARRTGVKIDWQWAPNSNYDEKVNTVLASNDIPDVIYGATTSLLLNQEAIIPLDDLLAEQCPNYLARLTDDDYAYLRNVSDGKMYFISHILDFPPAMSNLIRTDWVKKAGMEMPTTWDEYVKYWEWVRDNDANGNGDATDEIPVVLNGTAYVIKLAEWFDIKVNNNYFATTADGELVPLFEHEHFRDYLVAMVDLYQKGIIDKEFVNRSDTYKTTLDSSLAGMTFYFAERANLTTTTLRDTDPEGTFAFTVPPTYYEGTEGLVEARTKMYTYGAAITEACEKRGHVDAVLKLFNYIFSEEGSNLMNYGVEGRHHTLVDGKYVYTDEVLSGGFTSARKSGVIPSLFAYNFQADAYMQILTGGKAYEDMAEPMQLFYDALYANEPYFYKVIPLFDTESYIENGAEFTSKLTSIFAQCVVGEISVDDFFAQYETLKKQGWQDIIDEQIEAYEAIFN
ncbi:MAG: extracellular solute-binding protein [Clostridia bacterium]|nr:extracellular solute-binding protein [Clostridia bacterium]